MAGGEGPLLHGYHAEVDVLAVLYPIIAHELQHLEKLLKVQVLLVGHNVEGLYEVVGLFAVYGRRKVTGGVERRPVGAEYYAGGHIVCGKVNQCRALVNGEQTLFPQLVYDCAHLVLIEAFARVAVEAYPQPVVYLADLLEGKVLELLPEGNGLLVAAFDLLEPGPGLVVHLGVGLRLLVEADIELHQLTHGALGHRLVPPLFIGHYHLAELGSPVPQVVYAYGVVAQRLVYPVKGVAYGGAGQMAYVKGLRDVYGGILHADVPAAAKVAVAVAVARGKHPIERIPHEGGLIREEVEVAPLGLHGGYAVYVAYAPCKLCGYGGRGLAHGLCEAEAGEGVVAHGGVGRSFQPVLELIRFQSGLCRYCGGNAQLVFHYVNSPVIFFFSYSSIRIMSAPSARSFCSRNS